MRLAHCHHHAPARAKVFVVLGGEVEMRVKTDGERAIHILTAGDSFHAEDDDQHVDRPLGTARGLMIARDAGM